MNNKQEWPVEQPHHKWDKRCQKHSEDEKVWKYVKFQMSITELGWILGGGQKPDNGIDDWKEHIIDIGNCFVEILFPFVKLNGYCFQ